MEKKLSTLGCVVFLALFSVMPAAAEIVGDFPEVVLFSDSRIDIGQNSTVHSGDVVANRALLTPFALTIGNKATFPFGYEVKANSINVGNFVNLNGTTRCNSSVPPGVCNTTLAPLPVYGVLPIFQSASAGANHVNVPKSGSQVLTPGTYGNVDVELEGTITFQGPGIFNLGSFTTGRKAQIVITAAAEIRVAGAMNTGVEDNINLSGPLAEDVIFYVNGALSLGDKTTVNANFYVNGTAALGSNLTGTGAVVATGNVVLGQKVQLTLDTFFDFQPVPAPDTTTTNEDNAVTIDVLDNDSDPEGDPLFVNSFTQGANGSVSCSSGNPPPCAVDEDLEYTPGADFFGSDSFTYVVCDVEPLPNSANEDNCADPTTVSVTVNPVNDPPSFDKGPDQSVNEDAGPQSVPSWATNISPGPANESSQTVSFLVSNDNNALFSAQPAVDGSGNLSYTPADDAFGSATVTVQAQDDGGTANGGDDTSDPQTFTITVNSINDPPVAADDSATTPEDTSVTIDVLANDNAGPANEDQTLTIEPLGGSGSDVQVVGNQIQYTPPPDFFGNRVFTYTACDSGDGANDPTVLCDSAEVTVEVTPVNDPPTANPQSLFATETVTITLTGSDPDGDSLTFSVVSGPSKGTLGPITPVITPPLPGEQPGPVTSATVDYTPDLQQCSGDPLECPEDSFTFKVDDGDPPPGLSDTAVVTINPGGDPSCTTDADCAPGFVCNTTDNVCEPAPLAVIDAKDALIADETAYETRTGVAVAITLVAAAPLAPDPNAIDDLAFSIVSGPSGGTLSAVVPIDPVTDPIRSATTTFTPTCTPSGDPSICVGTFDFKACDAADLLNCDTATVEIVVSAPEDTKPPVAEDVSAAVAAGSTEGVIFSLVASQGSPLACSSNDDCDAGFVCNLTAGVCEAETVGRESLAASATGGFDPLDNGGPSTRAGLRRSGAAVQSLQLDVPTNWQKFTWWDEVGAGGPPQATCTGPGSLVEAATNLEGPFTFTAPAGGACLRVTDVLLTGDQFRILDNGQELATTPLVPQGGPNVGDNPDAAFASSAYSNAQIPLAQGSYSITIETIPGNSLWCGRGYLRVDTGIDSCDAEQPLLTYTILTVPDSSFGTLFDSGGQAVTAGTVVANPNLTFVPTATSGSNSQTTYTATNTSNGLVSNVANVNLNVVSEVPFGNCQTSEAFCDKGRSGGGSLTGGGGSPSEANRRIRGPQLTISVEGKGDVATSRRWHDGRSYLGVTCGAGDSCGGNFAAGSTVVIYARPTEYDSEFVRWSGDCHGSDPVTVVTVGRDMNCTAEFGSTED